MKNSKNQELMAQVANMFVKCVPDRPIRDPRPLSPEELMLVAGGPESTVDDGLSPP